MIDYIINNEEESINRTLKDWAQWDDTYQFIYDSNEEYIESNLQGTTLETLNLKMMLFLNTDGDIVYNNVLQLENGIIDDISDFITQKDKNYEKAGLLLIKDKIFIVAAIHITDSNAEAQSNGSLIFVREINEETFKLYTKCNECYLRSLVSIIAA